MSTAVLVEQLRSRARHLRNVSNAIGHSRALGLHTWAGPDTWVGPTPESCYQSLLDIRRHLVEQQEQLTRTAGAFERRAAELESTRMVQTTVS